MYRYILAPLCLAGRVLFPVLAIGAVVATLVILASKDTEEAK